MQQRPGPQRRRITRREYEEIMRRRKRQNMIYIGALAALALVLIIVAALILAPKKPAADKSVQAVSAAATEPPVEVVDASGSQTTSLADTISGNSSGDGADTVPAEPTPIPTATSVPTPRPEGLRSARLRVVGDVMVCESQLKAYKSNSYDFHPEFAYIDTLLQNADYTMANMEGTVGQYNKLPFSGYPMFNCPQTILLALKDSGVDFLTLANNHMLDRYFDGMKNTVDWVDKAEMGHVGAYRTKEERTTPVIKEINGIKIGFVAYTQTTNTMEKVSDSTGVSYGVPYLLKSDFAADIKRLREAGAEVVIAFPHWGKEYLRAPDSTQIQYAKKLAVAGADIIIGSHSHMVQPMGYQYLTDADGKQRQIFIMFSMGNFLSDHTLQYCDCGMILDFTINEHEDGTFTCDDVGYIPTYTWQPAEGDVRILPSGKYLDKTPSGMNQTDYARMVESYYEVLEVIGDQFKVLTE